MMGMLLHASRMHHSPWCVAHENLGSWFPRLRVTPHHFDFDVGSTVGMVALEV